MLIYKDFRLRFELQEVAQNDFFITLLNGGINAMACRYRTNYGFYDAVLVFLITGVMVIAAGQTFAQGRAEDNSRQAKKHKSYTQLLFLNMCSEDYFYHFNRGAGLDSKGRKQMINHIKASCQCMFTNLSKVFSENELLMYVQSRDLSPEVASEYYGDIPDEVYNAMIDEDLREECRHLNDMGASYAQ